MSHAPYPTHLKKTPKPLVNYVLPSRLKKIVARVMAIHHSDEDEENLSEHRTARLIQQGHYATEEIIRQRRQKIEHYDFSRF